MPTRQTDKAKIYIPENERERKALESLAEKGIVVADIFDGEIIGVIYNPKKKDKGKNR